MIISPRYDDAPVIDLPVCDLSVPLLRQRRRLEALLGTLDAAQWAQPSRCAGWSVQDVVSHLAEATGFWAYAFVTGLAGEPSRLLAGYDPVANPDRSVTASRGLTSAEVLERFAASNDRLDQAVTGLSLAQWAMIGEAPPGHLSLCAVAHHALWDGWVHEHDIAVPLGLPTPAETDEVLACLRYAAALSPAFALTMDRDRRGSLGVTASAPNARIHLSVDDVVTVSDDSAAADVELGGDAVELIDMLSIRRPLQASVSDADAWLIGSLATVFEAAD